MWALRLNLNLMGLVFIMDAQIVLADLPGSSSHQRLRVAVAQGSGGQLTIDLREQNYAEGIGWFDQRSLSLAPAQFKQLQAVLGVKTDVWENQVDEPPATLPFPASMPETNCSRMAERA